MPKQLKSTGQRTREKKTGQRTPEIFRESRLSLQLSTISTFIWGNYPNQGKNHLKN